MPPVRSLFRILIVAVLACPFAVWAQFNGNANNNDNGRLAVPIPTLDALGLAALAGGLAMAGTYVAMRKRGKNKR